MHDPRDCPTPFDPTLCADRWFRIFPDQGSTLVRVDVPPTRDEHVLTLAHRLSELAGSAAGRLALDLSVVEFYSWTWIRALIDLSSRCADMGGELRLEGLNPDGQRLMKANKTMISTGRTRPQRPARRRDDFMPIGGRSSIAALSERAARRTAPSAA